MESEGNNELLMIGKRKRESEIDDWRVESEPGWLMGGERRVY